MNRRTFAFVIFAVAMAAGCVRLGFWQLSRLAERRARNAAISARLDAPDVPVQSALSDSATAQYRQVQLAGRFDYEHEVIYTSRSRRGSPGVQLITPMRLVDGSAILVNRGWVYSPNGMSVDLAKWREGDWADVRGYLEAFTPDAPIGNVSTSSLARGVRHLVRDSVAAMIPYHVVPFIVIRRDGADSQGEVKHPFRLDLPAIDEGSHKSYAIQWFSFAVIAVVGIGAVILRGRQATSSPPRIAAKPTR
ncbi:MAG: SURF1 family protein [Gemmatimonadaceae bacterium]